MGAYLPTSQDVLVVYGEQYAIDKSNPLFSGSRLDFLVLISSQFWPHLPLVQLLESLLLPGGRGLDPGVEVGVGKQILIYVILISMKVTSATTTMGRGTP